MLQGVGGAVGITRTTSESEHSMFIYKLNVDLHNSSSKLWFS